MFSCSFWLSSLYLKRNILTQIKDRHPMHDKKTYANGQPVKSQEGEQLTYYFKTGIIKAKGLFIEGQMEGEWKFYRESGQLWQIGNFKNGIKNGSWLRYDKLGVLEYDKEFENGSIRKHR
jgi:antitoxin component YwqK of YwqJK toxin-antitoxin module